VNLLVLYQARDAAREQPGYFDGFQRLAAEGVLKAHAALAYQAIAREQGWPALWRAAETTARDIDADAVFLHFFHDGDMPDPSAGIRRLKALPSKPLVFASLGDGFGRAAKTVPRSFRVASALSDVTFLSGMGYLARQLVRSGSSNLALMPLGCCQVRFSSPGPVLPERPEFDVAFIGNCIRSANPFSLFYWASGKRTRFVAALEKRYGSRFGLFGNGWRGRKSWQGPIPYDAQHQAYRRSALALGGIPHTTHDYYTSDRVFIAVASGVPLVDYWILGVDRILEPRRDWWLARNLEEAFRVCDQLLETSSAARAELGAAARQRILAGHTQYHRCAEMMEIVHSLREARNQGRQAAEPALRFLRPASGFAPPAILAWRG
jgi:hypothetical protein